MGYVANIIASRLGYNKTEIFGVMSAKSNKSYIHKNLLCKKGSCKKKSTFQEKDKPTDNSQDAE